MAALVSCEPVWNVALPMFSTALVERSRVAPLPTVIELTVKVLVKLMKALAEEKVSMTTPVDKTV